MNQLSHHDWRSLVAAPETLTITDLMPPNKFSGRRCPKLSKPFEGGQIRLLKKLIFRA